MTAVGKGTHAVDEHQGHTPTRRTVAKGVAWSAPAVAVVATAPAYAASGPQPVITFIKGCKAPGNSCHSPYTKSYVLSLSVKNVDTLHDIYICTASMTTNLASQTPPIVFTWRPPVSGCIKIPKNSTTPISLEFTNSANSQNLSFNFTLTVTWRHNCPCSADTHGTHPPVVVKGTVTSTGPQNCPCPTQGSSRAA